MSKVLIIDQQPLVLEGCRHFLAEHMPHLCLQYACDENLMGLSVDADLNLVILGIYPDYTEQAELVKKLHSLNPELPILLWYANVALHQIQAFLSDNVKGYLSKKQKNQDLLTCLEQVLKGGSYTGGEISQDLKKVKISRGN